MLELLEIALSSAVIFLLIIVYTRLAGLRSFSKISSFDFAMTIAVGSILGSTILLNKVTIVDGAVGLGSLFALQGIISWIRKRSPTLSSFIDNKPLLVMSDGKFLQQNLSKANLTEQDVVAKLREANVLDYSEVRAVVFETTGDISVLHGRELNEDQLLNGVTKTEKCL